VEDGACAHGAGFERDVEGAAAFRSEQAIVVEREASGAEGYDFGVGGGVRGAKDLVVAAGEDLTGGGDDDSAAGDFASGFSGVGFGDGELHVVFVGERGSGEH